jgi:hypothetical protein
VPPGVGTFTLSGRAATLTSASWPQAKVTAETPLSRLLARVMGGPKLRLNVVERRVRELLQPRNLRSSTG